MAEGSSFKRGAFVSVQLNVHSCQAQQCLALVAVVAAVVVMGDACFFPSLSGLTTPTPLPHSFSLSMFPVVWVGGIVNVG